MPLHSIRVWPQIKTDIQSKFPQLSQSNAVAVLMAGWNDLTPEQKLKALQTKATDRRSWGRAKPRVKAKS